MKKYIPIIWLLVGTFLPINAKVNFGSPSSAIKISATGQFHLTQDLSDVDGTIKREDSTVITGDADKKINFTQGTLESNDAPIELTASYDPNDPDGKTILLTGNDKLRAEPGTIVEHIQIENANNLMMGQPLFSNPLVFTDANATLTMAIHSKLNQNIQLNNGTIMLAHDLELSDGVNVLGGGTLNLNNNQFAFGSKELNHTDNIFWVNADAEYLHGKTNLGSIWYYTGDSTLNGNGNVLDLSLGGTIFVNANTTLYITDLVIKRLGLGGIQFADETSKIILSNVEIELATNYNTTTGGFYVEGPTTFILEDKDWLFDTDASLSVDGIVLWTDRKGTPTTDRGMVLFGAPKDQHYSSINSGTIKEKVYLSDVDSLQEQININAGDIAMLEVRMDIAETNIINNSNAIAALADDFYLPWAGTLTTSVFACASGHLDPCKQIIIAADSLTLDGEGSMIVFSNPDGPQFIVEPGYCVTLQNLNLQNVNAKTFQLGECSCVKFGPNVTIGITEDVSFEGYKMEIIDGTLTIYGIGGIRQLGFDGSVPVCTGCEENQRERESRPPFVAPNMFKLNGNTLALKNIELMNPEEIDNNPEGKIKLEGTTIVNFMQDNPRHFMVEGIDNIFRMRQNGLTLDGSLSFGQEPVNQLRLIHKIPGGLTVSPQITFGDNLAHITSQDGIAELIFDDDVIRVINEGFNAFVLDENAFIGGRQVAIWDRPIRQISDEVDFADDLVLTSNGEGPIQQAGGLYIPPPAPDPTPGDDAPPPDPSGYTPGLVGYQVNGGRPRPLILRSPRRTRHRDHMIQQAPSKQIGEEHEQSLTSFTISQEKPLVLVMGGDTKITLAPEDVELKPEDTIYVSGKNNIIHITQTLTLNGELLFEKEAHLTIEITGQNPEDALKLPPGVMINPDAPIDVRVIGDDVSAFVRHDDL